MKTSNFENDEPIHHFEGKGHLYSCPCEPPFARQGKSSSPDNLSPPVAVSPPIKLTFHKLIGMLKKILVFKSNNHSSPFIVNYYFIENPTFETLNNSNIHAMKIIGQLLNYGTIQENNYYNGNEQQEENCHAEDVHYEDVNPKPRHNETQVSNQAQTSVKDYNNSPLIRFIVQKDKAQSILSWLHLMMDEIDSPKEKLFYLRAVYEAGHFSKRIPYETYVEEFGYIVRSRYFDWMGTKLNYDRADIDAIIEQFNF